jgi:hypothetical protein
VTLKALNFIILINLKISNMSFIFIFCMLKITTICSRDMHMRNKYNDKKKNLVRMRMSLEQIVVNFWHANQFKKKRHFRNLEIIKNNKI